MKGCAVKVTCVPEHMVVAVEVIFTESVPVALTVMVIALEVDVAGSTHEPDGVMTQVTTLPLASVVDV